MNQTEIICAGRVYTDLVFHGLPGMPELGTEIYAEGLRLHPGGGAYISAAYFAALGHRVRLLAVLPAMPFDQPVRRAAQGHGLDLGLCATAPPGSDPQVTVAMPCQGDRAFVTRRPGRALPGDAEASLVRLGPGARHLHIGELATLIESPALLAAARRAGMTVSLDCSWDRAAFAPEAQDLIAGVDLFLPNAAEAAALAEAGVSIDARKVTVIKRGAAGAEARRGSDSWSAPAHAAQAVDATGAGDAFDAGFISAWLNGQDIPACLEAGNVEGARAVTHLGGTGALDASAPDVQVSAL